MNKKVALPVTTLAATTGTAGLLGHWASAGCGATVEVHNRRNASITNTIAPGAIGSRAIVLNQSGSSWFVTSPWASGATEHIDVF